MARKISNISASLFAAILIANAAPPRSVLNGVYTTAQAVRGAAAYREECARCHSQNLMGGEGSPALTGPGFLQNWTGKTVGDLFERTRQTMPTDNPASLSRQTVADIIAHILSANQLPAGSRELEPEAEQLNAIRIEKKP